MIYGRTHIAAVTRVSGRMVDGMMVIMIDDLSCDSPMIHRRRWVVLVLDGVMRMFII
jgi:hypothetical protein